MAPTSRTSSLPLGRPSPSPSQQPWRSREAWLALHQRPFTDPSVVEPRQQHTTPKLKSANDIVFFGSDRVKVGRIGVQVRQRRLEDEWDRPHLRNNSGETSSSMSNKISHEIDRDLLRPMTLNESIISTPLLPPLLPSSTHVSSFASSRDPTPIPWSQSFSSRRSAYKPSPKSIRQRMLPKPDSVSTTLSCLSSTSSFDHLTHPTSTEIITPAHSHRRRRSSLPTINVSPDPLTFKQPPRKMSAPSPSQPTPDLTPTPTPMANSFSVSNTPFNAILTFPAPTRRPECPTRPLPAVPVDAVSMVDLDSEDDYFVESGLRSPFVTTTPPREGIYHSQHSTPSQTTINSWVASVEALREPQLPVVGKYKAVEWTVSSEFNNKWNGRATVEEKRTGRTLRRSNRYVERGGWI